MMKAVLVDLGKSWEVKLENGEYLMEHNLFGGMEYVELFKEDFGFDLKAAEFVEKHYGVEVWKEFPVEENFNFQ